MGFFDISNITPGKVLGGLGLVAGGVCMVIPGMQGAGVALIAGGAGQLTKSYVNEKTQAAENKALDHQKLLQTRSAKRQIEGTLENAAYGLMKIDLKEKFATQRTATTNTAIKYQKETGKEYNKNYKLVSNVPGGLETYAEEYAEDGYTTGTPVA